jgi:hypothetical protein
MSCHCKLINTTATIGSTFVLQFVLKESPTSPPLDLTTYRVSMAAKSKEGATLFTADSQGTNPKITIHAVQGVQIAVLVPESVAAQTAVFDVLISKAGVITPVIRGTIELMPQITDITP